jgi:hypothetical protein
VAGAPPALAAVIPLNEVKDDGQVFLRIRRSHPAGVLGLAAEKAENIRHGESLWLFQHGRRRGCPVQVKRLAARDPFTQSDETATSWQKAIHEIGHAAAG